MSDLVQRLLSGETGRMTAIDRLRMFLSDPTTFEFTVHDAAEIDEVLLECAAALDPAGEAPAMPVAWLCNGKGDGWQETNKIVFDPELAANYMARPDKWTVQALTIAHDLRGPRP